VDATVTDRVGGRSDPGKDLGAKDVELLNAHFAPFTHASAYCRAPTVAGVEHGSQAFVSLRCSALGEDRVDLVEQEGEPPLDGDRVVERGFRDMAQERGVADEYFEDLKQAGLLFPDRFSADVTMRYGVTSAASIANVWATNWALAVT
jgi:hypothetical protein